MRRACSNPWCQASFEVLSEDQEILRQFDCPEPVMCPDCRHQQRAMFSPQLTFYRNVSALSDEEIVTVYNPARGYKVYSIKEWWGDAWDPLAYGRPYDFSRPFFEQFQDLHQEVPKMANANENTENCEFSFSCGNAKNVYYSRTVHRSEDVYYSQSVTGYNTMVCDCLHCYRSSYLYECVQCRMCHYSTSLFRCSDCRNCHFCTDCRGCTNCLFCTNLRNTSHHIFNAPVSKEELEQVKNQTIDGRFSTRARALQKFAEIYAKTIWRDVYQENCEHCIGDSLFNCSHCFECYMCQNCEGNRYCFTLSPSEKNVSSMDLTMGGIGELLYNCTQPGGENYYLRMCIMCRKSHDLTYCIDCFLCHDCFGCTGLKNKEYCVLNMQYSKEEYEKLVPRIIEQMRKEEWPAMKSGSGAVCTSWGQFFPVHMTPFAYNESMAMFYFPLSKDEVLRRGWKWEEPPEHHEISGAEDARTLPDSIDEASDNVWKKVWRCTETGRPFKIIPQELTFYRLARQPLPRLHPDVRMERRRAMLNPYRLFDRTCQKCGVAIKTSYAPERSEVVYCEKCYLKTVY